LAVLDGEMLENFEAFEAALVRGDRVVGLGAEFECVDLFAASALEGWREAWEKSERTRLSS